MSLVDIIIIYMYYHKIVFAIVGKSVLIKKVDVTNAKKNEKCYVLCTAYNFTYN